MSYSLDIAPEAKREMEEFVEHVRGFSNELAEEQLARLALSIRLYVLETPRLWSHFFISGAPYHGYLFRFGRRHHHWIVYTVDDESKTVNVLRFWNASRDPKKFEV